MAELGAGPLEAAAIAREPVEEREGDDASLSGAGGGHHDAGLGVTDRLGREGLVGDPPDGEQQAAGDLVVRLPNPLEALLRGEQARVRGQPGPVPGGRRARDAAGRRLVGGRANRAGGEEEREAGEERSEEGGGDRSFHR